MSKFTLTFKTPDVLEQIGELLDSQCQLLDPESLDKITDESINVARKFVEYDECITVEFDTETATCRVIPRGQENK